MRNFLFYLKIYCITGTLWANNKPLLLNQVETSKPITAYFQIFCDSLQSLTLEDIFKKNIHFQAIKVQKHLHLGISKATFWLKTVAYVSQSSTDEEYIITFKDPSISQVECFIFNEEGNLCYKGISGSSIAPLQRALNEIRIAFPLKNLVKGYYWIFFKVRSNTFLNIEIQLEKAKAFWQGGITMHFFLGGFYAIVALVILYSFIAFTVTAEKVLLYAFLSSIFLSLGLSLYDGMLGFYTSIVQKWSSSISLEALFLSLGIVFLLFFNKNFLQLSQNKPIAKLTNFVISIFLSNTLVALISHWWAIYVLVGILPLYVLLVISSFIWAKKHKVEMSLNLLTANLFLIAGGVISLLPNFSELLSIWWAVYGLHIGYGLYTLIASLGLLIRFYRVSLEVVRKEHQILKEKYKKRIEAEKNAELLKMVQEKNTDLIRQNELLSKLNEELDRFVYSISHELNSPLKSLIGLINLMKQDKNPDNLPMYLAMQERSIQKLDLYTQKLTDLLRNARTDIEKDTISFRELINQVLEQRKADINYDKVKKLISIRQEVLFVSDKNRISIILNNLISNSIQYYRENVQPHVKIQVEVLPEKAIITISDNGEGIDKEHIDKVFNMFYRASEKSKGVGLGLFIVRETIKKLKGTIEMYSELNVGTIFKIEIPNLYKRENTPPQLS